MRANQRGQQMLLGKRETQQVRMGHDVLAMAVVVVVRDVQADLVHVGRPGKELTHLLSVEIPVLRDLRKQLERRALDAIRLLPVHVVAIGQRLDTARAHVLFTDATDQVVEQSLAQRAVGDRRIESRSPAP